MNSDQNSVLAHFDRLAATYDTETSWRLDAELLERMWELTALDAHCTVELGCGTGIVSSRLATDRVVAVDLSNEMCRRAGQRGVRSMQADLRALPFRDHVFDLLLIRQVLQYLTVEELPLVVQEISRVAMPGAHLVCHHFTVPPGSHQMWWQTAKAHIQPHRRSILVASSLDAIFESAGWSIDEQSTQLHRRAFRVTAAGYSPSSSLPTRAAFANWVRETGPRAAVVSQVSMDGEVLRYTQEWTLTRFRYGGQT